jgi:hypothetical protein
MPLAAKVFNRKKMAYSWVVPNVSLQAPLKWHPARRPLAICPKNKPFSAETLKAETGVAEPPKIKISLDKAYSFDLLSTQGSPTIRCIW